MYLSIEIILIILWFQQDRFWGQLELKLTNNHKLFGESYNYVHPYIMMLESAPYNVMISSISKLDDQKPGISSLQVQCKVWVISHYSQDITPGFTVSERQARRSLSDSQFLFKLQFNLGFSLRQNGLVWGVSLTLVQFRPTCSDSCVLEDVNVRLIFLRNASA